MDGVFGPLLKTVGWAIFIFILCPSGIFIIFRLIFGAYFKAKEKYEGGVKDGTKQEIDGRQNKKEGSE